MFIQNANRPPELQRLSSVEAEYSNDSYQSGCRIVQAEFPNASNQGLQDGVEADWPDDAEPG